MANTYLFQRQNLTGEYLRGAPVSVTTVAGTANTVAHGLPATPRVVIYIPQNGNGNWFETQPADSINLYITVGAGGPTAFTAIGDY